MGGYGIGQGIERGMRTAIQAGLSLAELKQRREQFDANQEFRYRYLASMNGWRVGMSGDDEEAKPAPSLSFPAPAEPTKQQVGRLTVPGMTPFQGPTITPAAPSQSATPPAIGMPSRGMLIGMGRRRF